MSDDAVFPPSGDSLSPNSGIDITMEDVEKSGELLDDEEEEFEIETDDLESETNQMFEVKSNELDNAIERVLGINGNGLENDQHVLEIDGAGLENVHDCVLELQSNGHESNNDGVLQIPDNEHSSQIRVVLTNDDGSSTDIGTATINGRTDVNLGMCYLNPVVGMEFESYDDAYNYYNSYAKELGFGIRVKSSWTKRNSKEKRGAVLCCNCEGFKTTKDVSSRRKETRTGCLAMVRLRLVESNRWRLDEVKLEHNHSFDHERALNSRSHKKMEAVAKRKLEPAVDVVEVRTIKLYRTPAINSVNYGSSNEGEHSNHVEPSKRLQFGKGDILALNNYFCEAQLADPNFFYIMDLNDEGYIRNVFWINSRSRAAYNYFGDVVVFNSTCLSNKYEIPLLAFVGLNHHGHSLLLGCGFLADESMETYLWLMRAWLTCMSGRTPHTIVTDHCMAMQGAISEVFPRAHHRFSLPIIMQNICRKFGEVGESDFRTILDRTVYNPTKPEEFELAWEEMVRHFAIRDHAWLQTLYEEREKWVPAYSKDTLFSGIYTLLPGECGNPFFHGYLHEKMNLNEFFSMYDLLQLEKIQRESLDDSESRDFRPVLRTRYSYELQLSELYTKEIFLKFQEEVVSMSSCFSITQVHANGPIITYLVKERDSEGDNREPKNFEVVYDKVGTEVRCVCGCLNFRGYLCRHALSVLNCNGVEEVPNQYILTRWRKDVKRLYASDLGSNNIDLTNPIQWFDHLYRRAMLVVAEGMASQDHHTVAWQAFKESLNKVRLVAEKPG